MHVFNGTVYYFHNAKQHVHVDACNIAAGAFWQGDWQYTIFEKDMQAAKELHINYKEVCAVVQAVTRWAPMWCGQEVIIHTDSTVAKAIINKGRSTNKYVNSLLRKMAWECAKVNCKIAAIHVAGSVNIMADTISRLHEPRRREDLVRLLTFWHRGRPPDINLCDHMSDQALLFLVFQTSSPH